MSFEKLGKKLGLGCMRLKMNGDSVDYDELSSMVDYLMDSGFNYFDTAHGYIDGKSEICVGDCISSRHNREDFVLANKLSAWCYEKEEDIDPLFESQLERCKTSYFDFYLLHSVNSETYPKYMQTHALEHIKQFKEQGKIKHIAISFHDNAKFLDMVLSNHPEIEAVQLQINYLDYDDPTVQSGDCYDVAVRHGKKVIVMEPVKGGALVNLVPKAAEVLDSLKVKSYASFALRYAASLPQVIMVLSGMGNMDMVRDNVETFENFVPFSKEEYETAELLRKIIRESKQIPCTGCSYCTEVCPKNISIPSYFTAYNGYLSARMTMEKAKEAFPTMGAKPGECIKCGKCEKICPQSIHIRDFLEEINDKIE